VKGLLNLIPICQNTDYNFFIVRYSSCFKSKFFNDFDHIKQIV